MYGNKQSSKNSQRSDDVFHLLKAMQLHVPFIED